MTATSIRRPLPDELDSVRAVVQTVVDETYGGLWAPPPLQIDEEDWLLSLVAVVDSKIVAVILTHEEWVSDLWVLREHRRCGLGQALLAAGETEITERGHRILRLRVVKSYIRAVNFYQRNRWQISREFQHEKFPVTMLEMLKFV